MCGSLEGLGRASNEVLVNSGRGLGGLGFSGVLGVWIEFFVSECAEFFVFLVSLAAAGDHIDLHRKRHGYRPDYFERKRKKDAREVHKRAAFAQKVLVSHSKLTLI